MPTDWELLDRYVSGKDQPAFAELVTRHIGFVYNSARRMLGGRDAEDVVQAVFFLLAQKSGKIARQGALAGWLFRATRYCCANVKTQERRRRLREQGAAKDRPESTDRGSTMSEDLERFLDDALARLGEKERQAVLVRYMEDKTAAETGAMLGVSAEAVEKRLERGIGKLRLLLSHKGFVAPGAALAGAMIAESAKAAPVGLAASVTTSGMSAAAASIAKGAAAMMKAALAKIAAVVICILLVLGITAGGIAKLAARADGPAATLNPPTGKITSTPGMQDPKAIATPANDPKQLFMDTLHELETAKHLTVEATRDERIFATDEVTDAKDQTLVNTVEATVQEVSIRHPDKLHFLHSGISMAKDYDTYSFETLFAHSSVWVATHDGDDGKTIQGHHGEMKNMTTDDILRGTDYNIRVFAPEFTFLLDSEAESRFFQFATDWKSLGGTSDLGVKVWRVQFKDVQAEPKVWEAWITQEKPHRLTRMILSGSSSMGITNMDENGDQKEETSRTYKTNQRIEFRFTKWDTTTPIAPSVFDPPKGEFTEKSFADNKMPYRIGDIVPLPALTNADGDTVDLSKSTAPIVLDFWFTASGSRTVWTPRVEALTDEFAKLGVKLYGINAIDSADQIRQIEAEHGWKHMTTLLDTEQTYQKNFSANGFPTVVVIGTDGKMLYREFPGDPAAMGRLEEVLRKATTPAPAKTPTTTPHP